MTSSKARITTLKLNALNKILNNRGDMNNPNESRKMYNPNCKICDVLLKVGERIVTKKSSGYVKWMHESCARSKNII